MKVYWWRLGIVLGKDQGALAKLWTPAQWGLGGAMGSGQQFWSWIHYEDAVDLFVHHALEPVSGVFNAVAGSDRQSVWARSLGKVLNRPSIAKVPAFALRLALGEMAEALLLASTRVSPQALNEAAYPFRYTSLLSAFASFREKAVLEN
jgi:hypothetical protein